MKRPKVAFTKEELLLEAQFIKSYDDSKKFKQLYPEQFRAAEEGLIAFYQTVAQRAKNGN